MCESVIKEYHASYNVRECFINLFVGKINLDHFSVCAYHPYAEVMFIFFVPFQLYQMSLKERFINCLFSTCLAACMSLFTCNIYF